MEPDDVEAAAQRTAEARDVTLRATAPAWRRARGVVHTPREVAAFMARRALRAVARACPGRDVVVVDPACGTGVFGAAWLAATARDPHNPVRTRRLVGLDVDPDALDAARDVLAGPARAAGVTLDLRAGDTLASLAPLGEPEVAGAAIVVLGNPPWAGRGAGRGGALSEALLDDFRADVRGERKLGVLSDDYVRFLRWSAELVRRSDVGGVLALVTNGSFLDGPVHRGLRAALLRWFDALDIVDLGGSALIARAAGRDENVFRVRPCVAITLAARGPAVATLTPPGDTEPRGGVLTHARLRGTADEKRACLAADDVCGEASTPSGPAWRFTAVTGARAPAAYAGWPSLDALFPFHREGVQTNRDAAVVDRSPEALRARLLRFAGGARDADLAPLLRRSAHFSPERARDRLEAALANDEVVIAPLAYRPFDLRWHCPIVPLCHRPRPELARAVAHGGLALVATRKDRGAQPFSHVGVVAAVPDNCWISARSSCRARAFPAYTPEGAANADARAWEDALGLAIDGVSLVHYALAVLSSPAYRARFDGALREDYPRLVPPRDPAVWRGLVAEGAALAALFLAPTPAGPRAPDAPRMRVGHHEVAAPPGLAARLAALDALLEPLIAALD